MIAEYPDSFPHFRPQVILRDGSGHFRRHVAPGDGNICLLGRNTRQWTGELSLAGLLSEQLEKALEGSTDEDPQGEPTEYWWNVSGPLLDSYILVDSAWNLTGVDGGLLKISVEAHAGTPGRVRGKVAKVLSSDGTLVASWAGTFVPEFERAQTITVPWCRLQQPIAPLPNSNNLGDVLNAPPFNTQRALPLDREWHGKIRAIVYPSEFSQGVVGDAWLFVLEHGRPNLFGSKSTKRPTGNVLPTYRGGEADIGLRVPSVEGLRTKTLAIVGVGAIGAPLAVDLARNGCGTLRIVEADQVEPGNSIRWPLGANAWGRSKGKALKDHLAKEYSWCCVQAIEHQIGGTGTGDGDEAALSSALDGADLAIDASASHAVTTLLHAHCRERGLPMISLYASPSVLGGAVVFFAPGGACPNCLEHHRYDKTVATPKGLGDEADLLQPPGCAERTFTGSSTDLQELSLEAGRVVLDAFDGSKPATSFVETLTLISEDGARQPPHWQREEFKVHPSCGCQSK